MTPAELAAAEATWACTCIALFWRGAIAAADGRRGAAGVRLGLGAVLGVVGVLLMIGVVPR